MLTAFFGIAGCGRSENSERSEKSEASAGPAYAPNPDAKPVDAATAGIVSGTVKLDGTPPKMRGINMRSVPSCQAMHDSPPTTEDVITGENGALQNVVVYLKGNFNAYTFPKAADPVMMDQKGCMYVPHVVALQTETPLAIHNSDSASHNSNTLTKDNSPWNQTQPVGGAPVEHSFSHPEMAIALKCNIHPWMKGYVVVQSHPYVAISGKDGTFEIKNAPAGIPLEFQVWHESSSGPSGALQAERPDLKWQPNGRFTVTLEPGQTLDLKDIKVPETSLAAK